MLRWVGAIGKKSKGAEGQRGAEAVRGVGGSYDTNSNGKAGDGDVQARCASGLTTTI